MFSLKPIGGGGGTIPIDAVVVLVMPEWSERVIGGPHRGKILMKETLDGRFRSRF